MKPGCRLQPRLRATFSMVQQTGSQQPHFQPCLRPSVVATTADAAAAAAQTQLWLAAWPTPCMHTIHDHRASDSERPATEQQQSMGSSGTPARLACLTGLVVCWWCFRQCRSAHSLSLMQLLRVLSRHVS